MDRKVGGREGRELRDDRLDDQLGVVDHRGVHMSSGWALSGTVASEALACERTCCSSRSFSIPALCKLVCAS